MGDFFARLYATASALMADLDAPETPLASRVELARLEDQAKATTDPAVLARYEQAVLDVHFPEFSRGNIRPYKVRSSLDPTLSAETMAADIARYRARQTPKGKDDLFDSTRRKVYMDSYKQFLEPSRSNAQYVHDKVNNPTDSTAGVTLLTEGTNFLHVVLGDKSIRIPGHMDDTRTCALETPVLLRTQQLADLHTAEHETGHAIDILKGTSAKREQIYPDDRDYTDYLGEHIADAYATLRMVSLVGKEGRAFAENAANSTLRETAEDGKFSDTALQQLTAPSIQQALDYASIHDLRGQAPSDLFTLAQQLIQPLSQDDYHALKDHLQKPGAVQARSTSPDIPPVAQQFFAQQDAAKAARPQVIAQLKEAIPQPEPALKDTVLSFDPTNQAQYVAMERFNAARRDASCPPFADEVPRFLANEPQKKPSMPSSSTPAP